MSAITTRKMTVAEYVAWGERPENAELRTELVDGEVVEMSSPGEIHGFVCYMVALAFGGYFQRHGPGYALMNDTGWVVSPDTVRGPDVSVFIGPARGKLSRGHVTRTPTVCVEVVSPSNRPGEIKARVAQYLDAGVILVWVIYPDTQVVVVHRPKAVAEIFEPESDITAEPELPGFSCSVAYLFTVPGLTDE